MGKRLELEGQKFGQLTVLRFSHCEERTYWICQCECGTVKEILGRNLTSGGTRSCGCSHVGGAGPEIDGRSQSLEYGSWWAMKQRCTDVNHKNYGTYGGAGIEVCERWSNFTNFIKDMGPKPTPEHSIDRIDGTKGYYKENCRWSTAIEQANNKC